MTERHELPERYDIAGTLGQLSLGRHDPCARWVDGVYWLAARTPQGPGSLALRSAGRFLHVEAYGEGRGEGQQGRGEGSAGSGAHAFHLSVEVPIRKLN